MPYEVGRTLDRRYRLKRLIARSERGLVFEADHAHLDRSVALRLLAEEQRGDARAKAKLLEEAARLDRVKHPGVIRVIDAAETEQGEAYLVTEALTGRPLDGLIAVEGRLPLDEALEVVLAVADALAQAHAVGIFHAGLASTSVLRTAYGRPAAKLIDTGVAPSPVGVLGGPLAAMAYAAPERLAGGAADAASDVYSLGALLHEMLTGELPERDAPVALEGVPAPLADAVRSALSPRAARVPSMDAFASSIREATQIQPIPPSLPPPARATPRAPYVTPVRLRLPDGHALDGRTEDISEGGLLILVTGDVEAEASVLVRFALPTSGRMVSVPAVTRWVRSTGGREALGVRFEDPGEKVLEDIRAYVDYLARPA